ncbi:hypothetical protein IFR04_003033 [Cadophora malorum]|uniref:Secreted protein n=1 Tax=Cadophora malorum TaxID=108018 RepID=A0A8H7WFQ5_9HELO|nr:hypothetical protein IFR04_003033 [Cadophora malorum]
MFIKSNLLAAALAVGYLVGGTHAGAAANVNGCVWYATKPITSFNVTFTVPTSVKQCMYETGNNAVALVTDAGLTCASVGHVSGKSSSSGGDTCATADSRWGISYNAGPKSGTTYSTWSAPIFSSNHVDLYDQSTGTDICGSAAKCNADSIKISSSGDDNIWIIFDPSASSSSGKKGSQEL